MLERPNVTRQLAQFVMNSPEAHDAFIQQMFHHLVQQPERAFGANVPDELRASFQSSQFDIRKLAVTIAVRTATVPRHLAAGQTNEPRKTP